MNNPTRSRICKLSAGAVCFLQSAVPLALRLLIGYQFYLTGKGKLANIERTTGFFHNLHIPFPGFHAHFIGSLESVGGLLLMAGLATRLISIPLLGTLVVAYLTAHRDDAFQSVFDFISAAPFPFLAVVLFLLAFGPGCVSIDRFLHLRFRKGACKVAGSQTADVNTST